MSATIDVRIRWVASRALFLMLTITGSYSSMRAFDHYRRSSAICTYTPLLTSLPTPSILDESSDLHMYIDAHTAPSLSRRLPAFLAWCMDRPSHVMS
ncbi:uncharacterized protein SCHCODRAFT_01248523 [Schizophyllum commune H4-8]|uniref:uncharacterized protein n=1 Tax=Schizophyllum commune (strain H4-8 / FGSC 9210) TaxID=578458 RepID=UPI00215F5B60|nr:uncharacterized protein SCHCODRAFT_01248523 [Schizophyllum commune H4-8]KAI5885978.1 hypothetical protein SCHCODRAFT_01248523 [Schizophyllum commune H4-8]